MGILAKCVGDLEAVLGRDRHVAQVEQAVDVASEQQPVGDVVRAAVGVRHDVRRLEHRQRVLARDRARAVVCVEHRHPEDALRSRGFTHRSD